MAHHRQLVNSPETDTVLHAAQTTSTKKLTKVRRTRKGASKKDDDYCVHERDCRRLTKCINNVEVVCAQSAWNGYAEAQFTASLNFTWASDKG